MSTPVSSPTTRPAIERWASALVMGVARHWLALFNVAWLLYVGLPVVAPILMKLGYQTPAQLIYTLYSFFCHQLPDHSYFLFGTTPVPLQPALVAGGMQPDLSLFQQRYFVGNETVGYKVAICERDIAIYGSIWLAGMLFALLRNRIQAIPLKVYLLLLIPIGVDGFTQLIGLHESNWWLRSTTGIIFGAGSVWLAYPFLHTAMQEVLAEEEMRLLHKTTVLNSTS